jgi:hypothetical protein
VFHSVASRIIRQPGSDHTVVDATHRQYVGGQSVPGGYQDGTPNKSSFGSSHFSPGRSRATSARIGLDAPRSSTCRERTIDTKIPVEPVYRCHPFGWPTRPGRRAERDSEHDCRLLPDKCFKSQSHFRVISFA